MNFPIPINITVMGQDNYRPSHSKRENRRNTHYCSVVVVQLLSCVRLFATPLTAALQASLSFTVFQSSLKLTIIESVMPSNHLILCRPLLLLSIFPSIRVFFSESTLHIRWSFSFSPSNEYSRLISFRIDWFDLPACPMDSQESSPAPQFESINSKALTLLYGPTLRSIHDCWKNHSFDYTDLCWQNNVCILTCCLDLS